MTGNYGSYEPKTHNYLGMVRNVTNINRSSWYRNPRRLCTWGRTIWLFIHCSIVRHETSMFYPTCLNQYFYS